VHAGKTGFSLPAFSGTSEKPYSRSRIPVFMSQHEIAVNIPQTLDPVYSNMIQIAYKDDEFTFVFLHQIPGVNQARAKAIVSITPQHAKNLLAVFTKTFADYESKFGKIETPAGKPQSESVTTMRGYS